ncbi:MAG: hypothetical protein EOP52_06720 [Sphingobacteriales bacterium]|nr:MAG: hypothetical protein EOP52_06720 [Sphingobacteriales bacterium]
MQGAKLLFLAGAALGALGLTSTAAHAQEGINDKMTITGSYASGAPVVTIGPNADITLDGDWYLTAGTLTIDPAARIGGTGTLHIMTPATYGAAPAATVLNAGGVMGNGTGIGCKVSLENGSTITLAGSNDLVLNNTLSFAKTGAHLILGSRNVVFTAAATAIPTATPPAAPGFSNQPTDATTDFRSAYIVTAGTGQVRKAGIADAASFSFPVGFSAANDLTRAQVTNISGTARTYTANVKDYATSPAQVFTLTSGNDRVWALTADSIGLATVALQDNIGTVTGTYNPAAAYVTQQRANTGSWDTSTLQPYTTPNYTHTRSGVYIPVSGNTAYFSKSSDTALGLNANYFATSLKVFLQGPYSGSAMTSTLRTNNLLPKSQPYITPVFNYLSSELVNLFPTNATDWVLVDLRNATNPATIVATRAALVLNNGSVVDLDGVSPVRFAGVPAGNYHIGIRHRNHLGIRTATAQAFADNGTINYDFTTAQSQAYQNPAITTNAAQASLAGGAFGMWAGNANGNNSVRLNGAPGVNDFNYIVRTALSNVATNIASAVYSPSDVNLNGNVRVTGAPAINDRIFIQNNVLGNDPTKTITQHQ